MLSYFLWFHQKELWPNSDNGSFNEQCEQTQKEKKERRSLQLIAIGVLEN